MFKINYKGDVPDSDKKVLDKFVKKEYKDDVPLPFATVVQLINGNRYSYTPAEDEITFERIVKWP